MLIVDLPALHFSVIPAEFVLVIPADPNTLPAPCGRHPAPTRGAIEACADGERDSSESESISEEETVTEAEARSKAGTPNEAAAKTCTTESTADKSTAEPAAAKASAEATATKTTSAETAATKSTSAETATTKSTSITGVGSDHGTHERDGSQSDHHLTQHGTFLPARASGSVFCSANVSSKNAIEKEIITRSQHIDGVDVPDFFVTIAASARRGPTA
jgi:hypothetical protein